jgi:cytochrome P450
MIKSNMSTAAAEQRLSTEQILGQIPTFLEAGHETTSTAIAWGLFALSQNKEAQSKLRTELLEAFPLQSTPEQDGDESFWPSIEDLNGLSYLDAVVKETLRWHPPVENTAKMAMADDIIPLDKPYKRTDGKMSDHIE